MGCLPVSPSFNFVLALGETSITDVFTQVFTAM